MEFLLYIFIILLIIKGMFTNKEKKVNIKTIFLVPIILTTINLITLSSLNLFSFNKVLILSLSLLIGIFFGIYRSRFYTYRLDLNNKIVCKKHIYDSIVFILFILFEGTIKFLFQKYDSNMFKLINSTLLLVITGSIYSRKLFAYLNYKKLENTIINKTL